MADVYLSPTMRRLVAKYGNQLKGRQGIDPTSIAYDLGLHEVTVQTLQRKTGLRRCKTVSRKGDREILVQLRTSHSNKSAVVVLRLSIFNGTSGVWERDRGPLQHDPL